MIVLVLSPSYLLFQLLILLQYLFLLLHEYLLHVLARVLELLLDHGEVLLVVGLQVGELPRHALRHEILATHLRLEVLHHVGGVAGLAREVRLESCEFAGIL